MNHIFNSFYFIAALLLISCGGEGSGEVEKEGRKEIHKMGTVEYTVEYPYFRGGGFAKAMLPKQMFFVFQDGKIDQYTKKGKLIKMGAMGSSKLDSVSIYLDFGELDIRSDFSGSAIKGFIESQTSIKVEFIEEEEKEILGFNCKKAIGKYEDGSNPDFVIWYTEELGVENPNFYNPFSEIKGVLMEFEMERFGLVSRIKAVSFSKELPEEESFSLGANFMRHNFQNFNSQIKNLFEKTVGSENLKSDALQQ